MNRSELVTRLADRARITKKRAEEAIQLVFQEMSDAIARGDRVEIRGFGTFYARLQAAYTGRNPRTGDMIHVATKRTPTFTIAKKLKEQIDSTKT